MKEFREIVSVFLIDLKESLFVSTPSAIDKDQGPADVTHAASSAVIRLMWEGFE